ncbi:MAG: transcription antiterminator [Erysipelotrichia bacterium]|nr:transcription antiterminator [Erysipelotrichia bacterium]
MIKEVKLVTFYQLLFKQTDFQKTRFFADELNVSTKTIYNYLSELEYQMKQYSLSLIRKAGVGLKLEGIDSEKKRFLNDILYQGIQVSSTSERRDEILEKLLMKDGVVSVRKLSEEYDVSKTSIVNDLEVIEKRLQKKELSLKRTKNGTSIVGKEQRIRSAKRSFIYGFLKDTVKLEDSIEIDDCQRLLAKYIDKKYLKLAKEMIAFIKERLSFEMGLMYYLQIYIQFSIFLDRISKGHTLISTPNRPVASQLHILKTYPIAVELCKKIEVNLPYKIEELDIRWVNARIAGVYHERKDLEMIAHSNEIKEIVEEMLVSVEDIFHTDLRQDKLLINGLEKHFVPMISRLTNNIKVSNPFIEQIKEQYTAMFSVIWLACTLIEKRIGFHLSEDEISFILIHFQAAMERRNLSKKIAIVSDEGFGQTQLITSRIKSHLPTFDVVEVFLKEQLDEEFEEVFDFVISTTPLENINLPNVVISPIASNSDISKINEFYYDHFVNQKEGRFANIMKAIDDDMILLKQQFTSCEEVLQAANHILMEKGIVKK